MHLWMSIVSLFVASHLSRSRLETSLDLICTFCVCLYFFCSDLVDALFEAMHRTGMSLCVHVSCAVSLPVSSLFIGMLKQL